MNINNLQINSILESHLKNFFEDSQIIFFQSHQEVPETLKILSNLRIMRIIPKEKDWVIYTSIGAWEFSNSQTEALEFVLIMPFETPRAVEILTMVVNYHRLEKLGFGHTFPIGESWLEDSECDHFLVSLPYPFGQKFEICHISEKLHVRFAWLLPITKFEKDFAVSHSWEELEEKFEKEETDYINPKRKSII